MFDCIPFAMEFVSEIEAVSIESGLEPFGVVDEKHGGFDVVVLA